MMYFDYGEYHWRVLNRCEMISLNVLKKSLCLCRDKTEGGKDEGRRPVRTFSLESMLKMTVTVAKHWQDTQQMYFICRPEPVC